MGTFAHLESYLSWLVNDSDHSDFSVLSRNDSLDLEYKRGTVKALMAIVEATLGGEELATRNETYRQARAYTDELASRSEKVARFRTDFPQAFGGNVVQFKKTRA